MNARAVALLDETATREYRAILRLISERQCDSLGDFAMAEHLRGVLTPHGTQTVVPAGDSTGTP